MFEEVMRFRADEQEFIARQEQKWYRAFVASEAMYNYDFRSRRVVFRIC